MQSTRHKRVRCASYNVIELDSGLRYRQDTTYNLTGRNCPSTVAHCLEAALEGSLARDGVGLMVFLRAMLNSELWVAAQLRKRAEAMAWTPGLVLDYARAMNAAIQPAPLGWYSLIVSCRHAWRYASMVIKGQPIRSMGPIQREVEARRHTKTTGP